MSVDIHAAFLQSKELKRELYVVPPKDIRKEGILWKLKKPLYGLNDASRRFWLRVREVFKKEGLQTLVGDEAFYFKYENGLRGMVITHVDDFQLAGDESFVTSLVEQLRTNLTVSKIEKGRYRFTGVDVRKTDSGIQLSMEDYANSFESVGELRKVKKSEELTKLEMRKYRKFVGKLNWLSENTRPDLSIWALNMSKKNSKATIGDLKSINKIIQKIKKKQSLVRFTRIDTKENLVLHVVGDASYRSDGPSIGGKLIMLGSKNSDRVNPILWKSKQIVNVCHSAKDAETRNILNLVEDGLYLAQQLSMLLFGSRELKIPVKVYTDSKPLLDSISSTKQVANKLLRNTMTDLKRKLEYGEVSSYSWIETRGMTADVLTKETGEIENILEVVRENRFKRANSMKNIVLYRDGEMVMENLERA